MLQADSGVVVRRANEEDARGIAQVHVRSWQAAYRGLINDDFLANLSIDKRQAMWERFLQKEPPIIFVAERDFSVVGFCSFRPEPAVDHAPSSVAELMTLYVQPEYWSKGIGAALWAQLLDKVTVDEFDALIVWVLDTNVRARAFYERVGFETDGATKSEQLSDSVKLSEVRYRRAVIR